MSSILVEKLFTNGGKIIAYIIVKSASFKIENEKKKIVSFENTIYRREKKKKITRYLFRAFQLWYYNTIMVWTLYSILYGAGQAYEGGCTGAQRRWRCRFVIGLTYWEKDMGKIRKKRTLFMCVCVCVCFRFLRIKEITFVIERAFRLR